MRVTKSETVPNKVDVIVNSALWHPVTLVRLDDLANDGFESIGEYFGKYFIVSVEQRDGAPVGDVYEVSLFWEEGDYRSPAGNWQRA